MLDRPENGDRWGNIRLAMGESMNRNLAVFREQRGIEETIHELQELKARYAKVPVHNKGKVFNTDLIFALELGFMLDCAETIAISALERKESRGAQFRTDYPKRDDENWLKHIVVTKGEIGPEVSDLPVVVTRWALEERKY
jgi:succinate dehydrogenase / fumarate reductase flavoprotein subunit